MSNETKRSRDNSFIKQFTFTPKALSYRLALEHAAYDRNSIPLCEIYDGLLYVKQSRDRIFYLYTLSFIILFLLHLGGLSEAEIFGIKPKQEITMHAALLATSFLAFTYSYHQSKMVRYDSLFNGYFESSNQAEQQHLILRYPAAFNSMQYSIWIVGRPKFMFPKRSFPIRLTLLLILIIPALIASISFWFWLMVSVSIELWNSNSTILGGWNFIILLISWSALVFSALLPAVSLFKRKYEHFGLTELLGRLQKTNPEKYDKRIKQLVNIQSRMSD